MQTTITLPQALDAYRKAIQNTAFWQDHGSWGDGKVEGAKIAEKAARAAVVAAR